jgi:hypothetical protein
MKPIQPELPRQSPQVQLSCQTSAASNPRQRVKPQLRLATSGSSIYQSPANGSGRPRLTLPYGASRSGIKHRL